MIFQQLGKKKLIETIMLHSICVVFVLLKFNILFLFYIQNEILEMNIKQVNLGLTLLNGFYKTPFAQDEIPN